jgi:hypothetical protein
MLKTIKSVNNDAQSETRTTRPIKKQSNGQLDTRRSEWIRLTSGAIQSQPIRTDRDDREGINRIGGSDIPESFIDGLIEETVDQINCTKNYLETLESRLSHLKTLKDATNQDEAFGLDVTTEIPNDKD